MIPIPEENFSHYLSADLALQYKIVPYSIDKDILTLLIDTNNFNESIIGELELITGYKIGLIQDNTDKINTILSKVYRKNVSNVKSEILSTDATTKVDDFLQRIFIEAKELKSSDIHIESYSEKCRIRFRIDGRLIERYRLPKDQYSSFINKVKIKAALDIAEKRLPQDGRILLNENNNRIDIRVSILPTLYGEKVVLRLLSNDSSHIQLDNLGLNEKQLYDFKKVLKKPNGIILISGPTGSGKTTTLYATLKLLNNESNNILTVEDPIEYTLEGINQVQLKENIGLTFSNTLRTFLRQDPDIIMLGEIRDSETAQMAIRAALTGHLVLSTIHTNSAWGTISRLVDMGIPGFLLANTLSMTVAQRLVRKLCVDCKQQKHIEKESYRDIEKLITGLEIHFTSVGCKRCYFTGYAGRVAIYEIIPIDSNLSVLIKDNALNIQNELQQRNIDTLASSAFKLVKEGVTSMEEVYPILLNY